MNIRMLFPYAVALVFWSVFFVVSCSLALSSDTGEGSSAMLLKQAPFPGMKEREPMLEKKYDEMRKKRGEAYTPRTRHLDADGWARYTNRLFLESSPYLLQHAHNPVNWYPWGDEAFEEAKRRDLPVFVSIGYSTCHWCHVMEEESFEDESIAGYLNAHFISIKVDREERPDIDAVYMNAVQALSGRGGWPLNVWLTPGGKPFYGGTYFPPRDGDRGASMGFLTILTKISEGFRERRSAIDESSEKLAAFVQEALAPKKGSGIPGQAVIDGALNQCALQFDSTFGGISGAPKFPSSLPVRLLLSQYAEKQDKKLLDMSLFSLRKMAEGGIYDQVGGGFHRYATDDKWLVPHFEKMLYDNALLVMAYLDGWQVSGDALFERIAREVLDYVIKEMTSPEGAFYSATDADTRTPEGEMEEGYFFTWTLEELVAALGEKDADLVRRYFAVGKTPNFEGRHILNITEESKAAVRSNAIPGKEFSTILARVKETLYARRSERHPPFQDKKILTSWDGLMISAFARAGYIFDDARYTGTATAAADFILRELYKNGRLLRSYYDGQAKYNAYLDDYAFFTASLIDLYEATSDITWLERALELDRILEKHYEDSENGGFFMTSDDHEALIAREKPGYDGALPSGNSVAAMNLLRLYAFTTKKEYLSRAEKLFIAFSGGGSTNAAAFSELFLALTWHLNKAREIIIVTPEGKRREAEPFLKELRKIWLPNRILVVVSEGEHLSANQKLIPALAGKKALDNKVTAYVCENGVCALPAVTPDDFLKQLNGI